MRRCGTGPTLVDSDLAPTEPQESLQLRKENCALKMERVLLSFATSDRLLPLGRRKIDTTDRKLCLGALQTALQNR